MNRVAPEMAHDFTLAGMRCLFKLYNSGAGAAQQMTVCSAPRNLETEEEEGDKSISDGVDEERDLKAYSQHDECINLQGDPAISKSL
jgi:hypothetical protein